jgi:outer membrane protein, heavy metal efflux system
MSPSRTISIRTSKTPSLHRNSAALLAALLAALPGATAHADQPLTEAEVIRLARTRAPGARIAAATETLAIEEQRGAGLLPDPDLGWERESLPSSTQDTIHVTVPIDVARPLARRSLARSRSEWLRAQASLDRGDAIEQALLAFHDVSLAGDRVAVLEHALASLEEAARVLARREAAGTASGYESTRLIIETELAKSRVAETRGALHASRARLAALLGIDVDRVQKIAAGVSPAQAPAQAPALSDPAQRMSAADALGHARQSLEAADQARARARWTWLPVVSLSAGATTMNGSESGSGYVAGISLSVPILARGKDVRAEARAQHALARARVHATEQTMRAELDEAHARYQSATQELERFESIVTSQLDVLLRAAQAGYREGERSLVELLDAQRVDTEVALRRLELQAQAKRAEIRARAASGELR